MGNALFGGTTGSSEPGAQAPAKKPPAAAPPAAKEEADGDAAAAAAGNNSHLHQQSAAPVQKAARAAAGKRSSSRKKKRKRRFDDSPTSSEAASAASAAGVTPSPSSSSSKKKKRKQQQLQHEDEAGAAEERDRMLASVPDSVRRMYGAIGFGKHGKRHKTPVMIVDPAKVPAHGPVWHQWRQAYHQTRQQRDNHLESLPYLVYYYQNDDVDVFGVLGQSAFTPYEVELQKGRNGKGSSFAHLPARIQKKLDRGLELTFHDETYVRAYREMEEDLKVEQSQRDVYWKK